MRNGGGSQPADITVDLGPGGRHPTTPVMSSKPVVAEDSDRYIGRYEILARIGEGGMASVFLARQRGPRGFHKLVVIKRIHPNLSRVRQFTNMFLDEARIAAQINHHRVVQIFELGEDKGSYFIAMEYLEGESLATLLTESAKVGAPPPPGVVGRILAQAADGLHAAHELRDLGGTPLEVVHRDVSPANVFVLFDGSVKVVDFGVAKAEGRFTQTIGGEIKGKFAYMSPEQLTNGPVDRRADIFALGIVLWESLAMKRLFRRDSHGATVTAVLGDNIAPPSAYRNGVWAALDDVAMRALERNPDARFQTADALREALEDALHKSPARVGASSVQATMEHHFGDRLRARREFLERVAASQTPIDSPDVFAPRENLVGSDSFDPNPRPDLVGANRTTLTAPPVGVRLGAPPPSSSHLELDPYERPQRRRWLWLVAIVFLTGGVSVLLALRDVPPEASSTPDPIPSTAKAPPEPAKAVPEPPRSPNEVAPAPAPKIKPGKKTRRPRKARRTRKKVKRGKVFLATIPRSTVYEGDRKIGDTPLVGVRMSVGRHVLTLVRTETGERKTFVLDVVAGEDTRVVHQF